MTDPSDDFADNLADIPDFLADGRHTLAVIGAVDPALLDLVDLALAGQDAAVIRVRLHFDTDDDEADSSATDDDLVRLVSHNSAESFDDEPVRLDVPMLSTYPTCSLWEVLAAVTRDHVAQDPGGTTVVLLLATIGLAHLLPGLTEELAGTDVRLTGAAHILGATITLDELLEHHQLSVFSGNTRCTGAVHLTNLGYADLVLALERNEDPARADLIEHLRSHDALLLPGLDTPLPGTLTALTHDVAASLSRIHPATTSAWGGPDEHDVRTLDLSASLPFHPECLHSLIIKLTGQGLCTHSCFWLPSRPGRVCTWEVTGGTVSVGNASTWAEVPAAPSDADDDVADEPRSHLVVTGVRDEEIREQVRRAFSRILLHPEEMAQALAWIGADDDLGDWLGQEG